MTLDGPGSQNFHFSLDLTATLHANVGDAQLVTAEVEESQPPAVEATAPVAEESGSATELAAPPASYWSLAHVVADALTLTDEATVEAPRAPDVSDTTDHADPHAAQVAAPSEADNSQVDAATATPTHDVVAEPAGDPATPAAAAPDDTVTPSLVTLALHHYATIDTLDLSGSAPLRSL